MQPSTESLQDGPDSGRPVDVRPVDKPDVEQSIPDRFKAVVRSLPDNVAVDDGEVSLTYRQLDARANGAANYLINEFGSACAPVAIEMEQSVDAIVAILGTLKAGKIFLPLDPRRPQEVRESIRALAGAEAVLTNADFPPADAAPAADIPPGSPACIFYTSGTTGESKGVVDAHRNILHNVMRYTKNLRFAPGDRLSLIQSVNFSGILSSLFGALMNGATICPYALGRRGIGGLAQWLARNRVTVYHSVPILFRAMLQNACSLPDMRVVRLEGDLASPGDIDLFRKHFEDSCTLAVGLGTTETGLVSQFLWRAGDAIPDGVVPVGHPAVDMDVSLDDGEICVSSPFLALGYWRDSSRTQSAFTQNGDRRTYHSGDLGRFRADGCLEFLGRKDGRIKIRGDFVHLADLEADLAKTPHVNEAAIVARFGARLTGFLVTAHPALVAAQAKRLVPMALVAVHQLPRTDQNKLDRAALQSLPISRPLLTVDYLAPRNERERVIAAAWSAAFSMEKIGVRDNFQELGGDSVIAAALASALGVPEFLIVEAGTVENLALRMERGELNPDILPLQTVGARDPIFFIPSHRGGTAALAELARSLHDQPVYMFPARPESTLSETAGRNIAALRRIQSHGPYALAGFCFGGVVALEMAKQLEERGDQASRLVIVDGSLADFPNLMPSQAVAQERRINERQRMAYHREQLRKSGWRHLWNALRKRLASYREVVAAQNRNVLRRHVARSVTCPIEVFLSKSEMGAACTGQRELWKKLTTGPVLVSAIPPDPRAMLASTSSHQPHDQRRQD